MRPRPRSKVRNETEGLARRVAELAPRAHGLAAALLGPGADAEDACQDAILAALAGIATYDARRGRLEPWLFAIVRRRCAQSRIRRATTSALVAEPSAPPASDEEAAMRRLDEALAVMPEVQRAAFVLVVMQDLTVAEAAAIENAAPGTIKSRVFRARRRLRESLESSHDPR